MQWIPAYCGSLTTVNQTLTNITQTRLHAYEHTNPHSDKTHGLASMDKHTHPHTPAHKLSKQFVQHLKKNLSRWINE